MKGLWFLARKLLKSIGKIGLALFVCAFTLFGVVCDNYFAVFLEKSSSVILFAEKENISMADVLETAKIEGVEAAEGVYKTDATFLVGEYSAQVELVGVPGSMLMWELIQGNIFPENSGMPYLLFNKVAVSEFEDAFHMHMQELDLREISVYVNGMRARLAGVMDDLSDKPRIYVNPESAKILLIKCGERVEFKEIWIKTENYVAAENIGKSLSYKNFQNTIANELIWDVLNERIKEAGYLVVISLVLYIGGSVLLYEGMKHRMMALSRARQLGMSSFVIRGIACRILCLVYLIAYTTAGAILLLRSVIYQRLGITVLFAIMTEGAVGMLIVLILYVMIRRNIKETDWNSLKKMQG